MVHFLVKQGFHGLVTTKSRLMMATGGAANPPAWEVIKMAGADFSQHVNQRIFAMTDKPFGFIRKNIIRTVLSKPLLRSSVICGIAGEGDIHLSLKSRAFALNKPYTAKI